mgnify:CR=1 FL=1
MTQMDRLLEELTKESEPKTDEEMLKQVEAMSEEEKYVIAQLAKALQKLSEIGLDVEDPASENQTTGEKE